MLATLVSELGDWFFRLAVPWLVYETTDSPLLTAVVYALEYLPFLVISPISGLLADRWNRRILVSVTNAAAAVLALSLAYWTDAPLLIVFVFVVMLGSIEPMVHPPIQAMLPTLVDDERHLPKANSLMQGISTAVSIVGPIIAGVTVVQLGAQSALLIDAASFCVASLLVVGIRLPRVRSGPDPRAVGPRAGGLREVIALLFNDSILRAGTLLFVATNAVTAAVQASLFFWFVGVQHESVASMAAILAAQGVGSLIGAYSSAKILNHQSASTVMVLGTVVAGGCILVLVLVGFSRPFMLVLWGLEAAAGTIVAVAWFTLRQRRVVNQMLGRAVALTRTVAYASIPIGSIAGGWILGATQSLTPLLLLSGIVQIGVGVGMLFGPLYRQMGRHRRTHRRTSCAQSRSQAVR